MQLQLDNNKKELKSHGTYAFPVNVSYEQLSRYERKSFLWHWHKEIELTILLQGEMQYQVNDTIYHLQAGEGLFCNSNRLHTGSSCHDSDCIYISTTFHPRFLYGYEDSVIQNKYLNTITKHPGLHSLAFSPDIPWQKEVLDELSAIWMLSKQPSATYEMELQWRITHIWMFLWNHLSHQTSNSGNSESKHTDRLKNILMYIQEHYAEKITLADIAATANICQSECCRFFKKHMNESLFDYLLPSGLRKAFLCWLTSSCLLLKSVIYAGFPVLLIIPKYFGNIWDAHQPHTRPDTSSDQRHQRNKQYRNT